MKITSIISLSVLALLASCGGGGSSVAPSDPPANPGQPQPHGSSPFGTWVSGGPEIAVMSVEAAETVEIFGGHYNIPESWGSSPQRLSYIPQGPGYHGAVSFLTGTGQWQYLGAFGSQGSLTGVTYVWDDHYLLGPCVQVGSGMSSRRTNFESAWPFSGEAPGSMVWTYDPSSDTMEDEDGRIWSRTSLAPQDPGQ